jgi:hypothetical protein
MLEDGIMWSTVGWNIKLPGNGCMNINPDRS